jgi:curli biogenesis system outer membrane secretion channel CsgG
MRRVTDSMVIAIVAFSFLTGCAAQSAKTVETEKTVHYSTASDQAARDPIVEHQTTKTEETTQTDGQSVGVLSGTVHVVGQALALPFHVVGGLIGAIF